MRFSTLATTLLLSAQQAATTGAATTWGRRTSFERAVMSQPAARRKTGHDRTELYRRLMSHARPYTQRNLADEEGGNDDQAADADDAANDDDQAADADDGGNDDDGNNANGNGYDYDNFDFDVTNYSLKYVKCQMIKSYSDNLAAADDGNGGLSETVLAANNYVVFRFCPTQYCYGGGDGDGVYGCDSDFGEYIVRLGDYLAVMAEYTADRRDAFCNYCQDCMQQEYGQGRRLADEQQEQDGQDEGDEQDEAEDGQDEGDEQDEDDAQDDGADEDAQEDEAQGDDAVGDDAAGDDAVADDDDGGGHKCADYDVCYNYEDTCNAEQDLSYQDYFDCVQFQSQYGDYYYLGPKCGSDGVTISIGLFSDQYCSVPVDDMDIYSATGVQLADDPLAGYYDGDCISCRESELPWEEVDEDAQDDDEVSEICENLYYDSAKCNRYYKYYSKNSYGSYEQADSESTVCTFIENVLTGYDEYGEIVIDSSSLFDWKNLYPGGNSASASNQQFASETAVTGGQIGALVVSIVVCVALAGYSCYLHRAIMRKAPWRPNRGGPAAIAGQISRQNSGIIMGRSRSGGSYTGGAMT